MKTKCLLFCGLLGLAFRAVAQDASPAPAAPVTESAAPVTSGAPSNVSMEDTIQFLRDAYAHQGTIEQDEGFRSRYLTVSGIQEKSCELTLDLDNREVIKADRFVHHFRSRIHLFLENSDPLSLEVRDDTVVINRASAINDRIAFPIPPGTPEDVGNKWSWDGYVTETSPNQIVFAGSDEHVHSLKKPLKNLALRSNNGVPSLSPDEARVGDYISIFRPAANSGFQPSDIGLWIVHPQQTFPAPVKFSRLELPPLEDREMAPRVARALVHAIVLCQKGKKPSPF